MNATKSRREIDISKDNRYGLEIIDRIVGTIGRVGYSLFSIIIFLILWEAAPRIGIANPVFLPPFSKVFAALWQLIISGSLFENVFVSLKRSAAGFALALLVAIPLGLVIGWFKKFERFIDPLLQIFRQTSALALFPVFILVFGIGETSKIAIIFWGVQWPILISTIEGVKNVDPILIKSAKSMGASPLTLFYKVIFPGAFPSIFTGIRLSATTAIIVLVAAEMIGANAGLGFLIFQSQETYKVADMYASIVTIALIGFGLNYLLVLLQKNIMKWKQEPNV
ncbi:ABC transporter permease [Clostridium sp. BJN0013]|uniref:ABC transporter permease n=1 Tax=Clostridium sp. BJN0013 TaxID=3236840 RepID=UPI0034C5D308